MNFFLFPLLESPFCAARQVPSAESLPTIKACSPCQISLVIPNCSEPLRYPASPSSTLTPPSLHGMKDFVFLWCNERPRCRSKGDGGDLPWTLKSLPFGNCRLFLYFQFWAGFFPKWNLHRISLKAQQWKIPWICDRNLCTRHLIHLEFNWWKRSEPRVLNLTSNFSFYPGPVSSFRPLP